MPKSFILYKNVLDGSTLTAANDVASLPVQNVLGREPQKVARFAAPSTVIDVDLGDPKTARALYVGNIRGESYDITEQEWSGLDTAVVRASNSSIGLSDRLLFDAYGDVAGSSFDAPKSIGVDTVFGTALLDFGEDITARYWRFEIRAADFSVLEIGRLYLGAAISLTYGPGYPLNYGILNIDERAETETGFQYVYARPARRTVSLTYGPGLGYDELIDELYRRVGFAGLGGRQVVWVEDPTGGLNGVQGVTGAKTAILGTTEIENAGRSGYVQNGGSFRIVEVGGIRRPRLE